MEKMNQIEAMLKVETNYDTRNLNTSSSLSKTNKNSLKLSKISTMKKSNSNHRIYYGSFDTNSGNTSSKQQTLNEIYTGNQSRTILNEFNELPRRDSTSQDFDLKFKTNKFLPDSKHAKASNKQKMSLLKTPVIERTNSDYNNLKRIQRNQIYALNELMTKLEHENFVEFCEAHNIEPRC